MTATQQVIDTGLVVNDGTGESLRDAFTAVNNNFANIWAAGPVGTQVVVINNQVTTNETNLDLIIAGNGIGNVKVSSTFLPTTANVYDIGSPLLPFSEVHGQYIYANTFYGDLVGNITGNLDAPGGNTQVMFNDNNVACAVPAFTFNKTSNLLTVSGNVSSDYLFGNAFFVTGLSPTRIYNGNSSVEIGTANGNVSISVGNVSNTVVFANTVTDFNTPVNVNGNVTADFFVGNIVGNVTISAADKQVIFSNNGTATGDPDFTFDKTTNILSVNGNITASGNVAGNYIVGNGAALTSTLSDRGFDLNNWDTLFQMGTYTVNRLSWSGTIGAPLDSQVYVGLLEVKNSTNTAIEQVFYPGQVDLTNIKIQWSRTYWSGSWTPWVLIINGSQQIDGGEFF